jgi:hypothetical protein
VEASNDRQVADNVSSNRKGDETGAPKRFPAARPKT